MHRIDEIRCPHRSNLYAGCICNELDVRDQTYAMEQHTEALNRYTQQTEELQVAQSEVERLNTLITTKDEEIVALRLMLERLPREIRTMPIPNNNKLTSSKERECFYAGVNTGYGRAASLVSAAAAKENCNAPS